MKGSYFILSFMMLCMAQLMVSAQGQLDLYEGNEAYREGDYNTAEERYQKALSQNPNNLDGAFNQGNAIYRQENYTSALEYYQRVAEQAEDSELKASALHNLGNTYLQSEKFKEAVDAYKNALRANPADDDTRYNLAYAQRMLKQQEQQEQEQEQEEQEQEEQEQEQEQDQDQQKQEEQENKDKGKDKKDNKNEEEDQQEKNEQQEPKDENGEQQQKKPLQLSPREAEQLLEAARNQDQQLQLQLRKQKGTPKKIEKDW